MFYFRVVDSTHARTQQIDEQLVWYLNWNGIKAREAMILQNNENLFMCRSIVSDEIGLETNETKSSEIA